MYQKDKLYFSQHLTFCSIVTFTTIEGKCRYIAHKVDYWFTKISIEII